MGLIAHYRLDGSAEDAVGEYGGTTHGTIGWVDGKLGQAADFDGNSGYISDPRISDYLHGRPEASIALWVKKDAVQYGFLQLSGFANSNGNLYPYSTETRVYLDVFRTNRLGPIYLPKSTLEWHHCVITQSPGVWRLYQDGELVHETTANNQVSTNYLQFEIGRNSGGRYANGKFQDVRIYDHALSPREVRDLSLGLVGHYPLFGDAVNSAGYNSGSLHGSVVFSDIMGGSAKFDNSSYIQLETGISGDPDELSASFWAKTDTLETYDGLLQFDGVNGYEDGFVITGASSTTMRLRYWSDGGTNTTWSAGDFATGKESHFCVTLKEKTFTIYQDGEKVGEVTHTNPLNLSGGVKLGLYSWSSSYFTGWIKDARIYATALTAAQIKELYQQRASIDSEGSVHVHNANDSPVMDHSIAAFLPYRSSLLSTQGSNLTPVEGSPEIVQVEGRRGVDITSLSDVVSYGPAMSMGMGDMSFSMWLYPRSSTATINYTFSRARAASQSHRYAGGFSSNLRIRAFMQGDGGPDVAFDGDKEVTLNAWNHVVWVFDRDGDLSMHLNGEFAGSRSIAHWSEVNMTSALPFRVGSYSSSDLSPSSRIDGVISDFRVYRRALEEDEILELSVSKYHENTVGLNDRKISEVGVTRGLVAWYPLIGDTQDYAGTNHAVNNGAVATAEGYEFDGSSLIGMENISGLQEEATLSCIIRVANRVGFDVILDQGGEQGFTLSCDFRAGRYSSLVWRDPSSGYKNTFPSFFADKDDSLIHVTVTFQDGVLIAYKNGEHFGQSQEEGIGLSAAPLSVGLRKGAAHGFTGTIRDVRIYNRALTPEEVAIQAKLTLMGPTGTSMVSHCLYTNGQFKEVIC